MTKAATKRTFPLRLILFWICCATALIALSVFDIGGDPGTSNVAKLALSLVAAAVTLLWFALTNRWSLRFRLGSLLVVASVAVLFFTFFRVNGFTGALLPIIEPRSKSAASLSPTIPTKSSGLVDLETTSPLDFAGFLGSQRNLEVPGITLDTDLDAHPPEQLWRQPIGSGLGGFAVVNGFAATLEQREDGEWVSLYSVDTGDLAWATKIDSELYKSPIASNGPRSTPLIEGGRVYAMGVSGHLVALDGTTGKLIWDRNFRTEAGLSIDQERALLTYGRPNSPLVTGDLLLIPVGGRQGAFVSLAALDKSTGKTVWRAGTNQISGASPNVANLAGIEQVLLVNEGFVNGFELDHGRELWAIPWPGRTAADTSSSQAVPIPPNRVFLSRGYGTGGALYQLAPKDDGSLEPTLVWQSARVLRTKFSNVTAFRGHIYGLSEGVLECVDLDTGKRTWKHGRYGHGQMLRVDDVLVILTEDGEIVYVEASPEHRDNVLARFQAIEGQTWNNFAISGDRLLVRNGREAAAYRLPLTGSS